MSDSISIMDASLLNSSVCGWTDIFDVCGIGMVKSIASEMHYCPNCGAKMGLGGDDNA